MNNLSAVLADIVIQFRIGFCDCFGYAGDAGHILIGEVFDFSSVAFNVKAIGSGEVFKKVEGKSCHVLYLSSLYREKV